MPTIALHPSLKRHWFVPLALALILVELAFARTTPWPGTGHEEAAILFDMCLFVPLLHALCYRRILPLRALLIRTAALSLAGLYLASLLVPAEAQRWIDDLGALRLAGLAVLALIELWVLVEVVKILFGREPSVERIVARSGAPAWVARLMLLEARFWKWVWRRLRGR